MSERQGLRCISTPFAFCHSVYFPQAKFQQMRNKQIPGASGSLLPAAAWPCLHLLPICFLMTLMLLWYYSSSLNLLFNPTSVQWIFILSDLFSFSPMLLFHKDKYLIRVTFELCCFLCHVSRGWKMLFLTVNKLHCGSKHLFLYCSC